MARHAVMTRQVCPLLPIEPRADANLLVSAEFVWREEGILELSYGFRCRTEAVLNDVLLPSPATNPQRCDELWKNTCLEAFLALPGKNSYWELNISPTGDWNLYSFKSYRSAFQAELGVQPPFVSSQVSPTDFRCDVLLNLRPWLPSVSCPELSLTAVLKHTDTSLSYWAIRHTGKVADFHDRRSFVQP